MKVSVIIPTYNRAHLIHHSIDSILAQEFSDLEIIIVDDGSTDGTKELLHSRYREHIHYVYQHNQGFASARNQGVEIAKGEYIAFLDSDDIWKRGKLALQVSIMDEYPDIAFLFTDFLIMKESGQENPNGLNTWFSLPVNWPDILPKIVHYSHTADEEVAKLYTLYLGNLYRHLLYAPYVLPSTAMVRKKAIPPGVEHTVGDPFCADWNFFSLLSQKNETACFLESETTINRSHSDAVRSTQSGTLGDKLKYRLSSIKAIWRSDLEFMQDHADEVMKVESDTLLKLAKQSFRQHRYDEATTYLNQWRSLDIREGKGMAFLLSLLLLVPSSSRVINLLR